MFGSLSRRLLTLVAGIIIFSALSLSFAHYKKHKNTGVKGIYSIHRYTTSTTGGCSAEDEKYIVVVKVDNPVFSPNCYRPQTNCMRLMEGLNKMTWGDEKQYSEVGTMEKTWYGFISHYTQYDNKNKLSWTMVAEWEKISELQ